MRNTKYFKWLEGKVIALLSFFILFVALMVQAQTAQAEGPLRPSGTFNHDTTNDVILDMQFKNPTTIVIVSENTIDIHGDIEGTLIEVTTMTINLVTNTAVSHGDATIIGTFADGEQVDISGKNTLHFELGAGTGRGVEVYTVGTHRSVVFLSFHAEGPTLWVGEWHAIMRRL